MKRIAVIFLVVGSLTLDSAEVRLVGDTCPIRIETALSLPKSSAARPSLVDGIGVGAVLLPSRAAAFVAEVANADGPDRPTCEMVLVDSATIGETLRFEPRDRRFEARRRWSFRSPYAKPHPIVQENPGTCVELTVEHRVEIANRFMNDSHFNVSRHHCFGGEFSLEQHTPHRPTAPRGVLT